jgi:hypothetical protein
MTDKELEILSDELFEDLKDLKIRLGRFGKFDRSAVFETYDIIIDVIKNVEEHSTNMSKLSGSDKKDLAVLVINKIIDIPFLPEYFEGVLIEWSIELSVQIVNKIGGKDWLNTLFGKEA